MALTYQGKWAAQHKIKGLCTDCNEVAIPGKVRCKKHVRTHREYYHRLKAEGGLRLLKLQYKIYKHTAKGRGHCFSLSKNLFESIVIQKCHYCRTLPPENRFNGIDRVNNFIGYTPKNSVACCRICNIMKMALSKHEFLNHIRSILKHQRKKS